MKLYGTRVRSPRWHSVVFFANACLLGFNVSCGKSHQVMGKPLVSSDEEAESSGKKSKGDQASASGRLGSDPAHAAGGSGSSLGATAGATGVDARRLLEDLQVPSAAEVDAAIAAAPGDGFFVSVAHLGQGKNAFDLEVYRFGLIKALNSVSTNPEIIKLQPVDPAETVYRLKPADFRLNDRDMQLILSSVGADRNVRKLGSKQVINGDWLVYVITRPEIYDTILRIPNTVGELEAQLGINMNQAISAEIADGVSEVTFGRRTLIRTPIEVGGEPGGYYWRSIDYFTAVVAGEFFFSLPNGLQAYMLSGFATQHRIDAQPFVATDRNRPQDGLTQCVGGAPSCGYVINGESCITCHANGVKLNTKFSGVQGGTAVDFEGWLAKDADRFARALAKMGFDSIGVEPVLEILKAYRNQAQITDRRNGGGEVVPVNPDKGVFQR